MKSILISIAFIAIGIIGQAHANAHEYELEFVDAFGTGCPDPSVISVKKAIDGSFFIEADFDESSPDTFSAFTDANVAFARTDCTIRYNIHLDRRYKLESNNFDADGEYSLTDEGGRAFFSIRQNVPGVSNPVFATVSFSATRDPLDDAWFLEGELYGLSPEINYCGATIPIEVQVRGSARRSRNAQDDTFIAIFNGSGEIDAIRGFRQIRCKPIFIPCF